MGNEQAVLQTKISAESSCDLWLDFLGLLYHTYYCAHSAHWNVKGAAFSAWHDFFKDAYEQWHERIDIVAEHIRSTYRDTDIPVNLHVLLRRVQGDPTEGIEHDGIGYFQALLVYQEGIVSVLKALIEMSEQEKAHASLDLATETLRDAEKLLWQTRSHLE